MLNKFFHEFAISLIFCSRSRIGSSCRWRPILRTSGIGDRKRSIHPFAYGRLARFDLHCFPSELESLVHKSRWLKRG